MTLYTENGWPQIPADELDKGLIPGTGKVYLELRSGDVSTILKGFAAWLHRNVADMENNYNNGERDDWGWSRTNSVWDSNHLSGTAFDYNATQWPMGYYNMPRWMVDKIREGLRLFEGTVFWGRDWDTPDEMHFQIQGNAQQIAPFAQKLRDGYLGIWQPADPLAYRLPLGYYYGPLDGPNESVSGLWKTDSDYAKDGLGMWQEAVGIPVSKHWDDATFNAVTQMQNEFGWQDSPFYGRIYVGEWDAAIKNGWKYKPGNIPDPWGVHWSDVSQYQDIPVNNEYPDRIFSFRVSTGDDVDDLADANYREACRMADEGRLDAIIAYSFFRPHSSGHSTYATFKQFFDERGIHPKLCALVDVENGENSQLGAVRGDQSHEANGFVDLASLEMFGGDRRRVGGYHNFVRDPDMWLSLPPDLKMIRPNYNIKPGQGMADGPQAFALQYTEKGRCAPWGDRNVDRNYYPGTLSMFLEAWGLTSAPPVSTPVEPQLPIEEPRPVVSEVTLKSGESILIKSGA